MEIRKLEVTSREGIGKGNARKIRREGVIPAVFYGAKSDPIPLAVDPKSLLDVIDTESGENTLITLASKGSKELEGKVVIMKDRQQHPITKDLIHVDFYEIAMDRMIEVEIPVVTKGKAAGIEDGGTLQLVRKELLVECLPNKIPEKIEIDVTPLKIGDTIHIEEIAVPDGVNFIHEKNFTVVNVVAPTKEEEPEAVEGEEGVEGEAAAEGEAKAEGEKREGEKKEASPKKEDGKKEPEKKPEKK